VASLAALAVLGGTAAAALAWLYGRHLEAIVVAKLEGRRWALPSRIYSDAFLVYPGLDVDAAALFARLDRLGYREGTAAALRKGDYRRTAAGFEVHLHDFAYPGGDVSGQLVRVQLVGGRVGRIEDAAGTERFSFQLEPEVITGLYDTVWEERRLVTLDRVPPLLVRAIITTEDQRFYSHHGIDFIGILRALLVNLRHRAIVQGGSTLTQQLVKNFFLTDERTVRRKLRELVLAPIVERRYTKAQILEAYLNEIYLGQHGLQGIFGVWEGAHFYFAHPPEELTVGEIGLLAGLIRAPNRYSPHAHPAAARERRAVVLQLLHEAGDITDAQYREALAEPLRTGPVGGRGNAAPYFVDFLNGELARHYPREVLITEGLRIFTGLDPQLQRLAQQTLRLGLEDLERRYPRLRGATPEERLQGCLIAMQPQTGEIKAMVGGRDYRATQYNRAVRARRQPGSIFKPFVYLAAFEQAPDAAVPVTPVSRLTDEPFEWAYDAQVWRPENHRDRYFGNVSVRQALEFSLNAATARLAQSIGLDPILDLARRLGITSPLPPYPSVVLGALEVSPFEIAQAYAVLANNGLRAEPRATRKVVDADGRPIERYPVEVVRVASPEAAYLVTHLMEGVLARGTGAGARALGFARPAAGKTGTTNDARDAWFAGFTPELLAVVWVGFDERKPLGLTGAAAALPIWTAFMKGATAAAAPSAFVPPPGVTLVRIDPLSGAKATPDCPETIEEAFWRGQEPTNACPLHGGAGSEPAPDAPAPIFPPDTESIG
jgi:penicillin-binding protein 1B